MRIALFCGSAAIVLGLSACKGSFGDTTNGGGDGTGAPTVIAKVNQSVGHGFPHRADHLYPSNRNSETRAIVAIHGGGGTKHSFSYSLGIKFKDNASYDDTFEGQSNGFNKEFILRHNIALIFVQGQAIPAKPDSYTWSNTIMNSGQDDKTMLENLAADLRADGFSKVYLMGHSMGGAMANRMWCESPSTFDGYGSSAGPMSVTVSASCAPSSPRPYIHVTGLNDRIIQIIEDRAIGADIDHSADVTLTLDSVTRAIGGSAFIHAAPEFQNELVSYADRVQMKCGQTASAVVSEPNSSSWKTKTQTDCGGTLKMIQVRGADHCVGGENVSGSYKCDQPLTTWGTQEHLLRFVEFFAQH